MMLNISTRESLFAILRLSAAEADALRADLLDVTRARAAAKISFDTLQPESASDKTQDAERMKLRRRRLLPMLETLDEAESAAREKLAKIETDIDKFQGLMASKSAPQPAGKPSGKQCADTGIRAA